MEYPASTNGGGMCQAFPDVCKTPPVATPVPYPNIAMLTQINGGTASSKVLILNKKTATTKTEITMSSGDEAGTAGGGVVSNRFKGPAKFKKGSSKVFAEGSPIVYLTSMIGQNGVANANHPAGLQVQPSQSKVHVSP
jgi:hypothetical protein